ncbi:hypothetical protein WK76_00560 [Burkholderia ubonensis]|uniref:hypothetical protein n=1 Tax=Burkholderia ubonensis TaxID=101571 RepID=UPI00075D6760|nr:hypothetical protein [Burkholderia ubonensis]KVU88628.1 hypothetical protein WK76_00560 [Burkholderia ubonensis]
MSLLPIPLALSPVTCWADVGGIAGIVLIALWIFVAVWGVLTCIVYVLPRRYLSMDKRCALAVLFFVSPVLTMTLVALIEFASNNSLPK